MKKYIAMSLTLLMGLAAQTINAQEEMQFLFGGSDKNVTVSGFAGVFNEFSAADKHFAFYMGGGAALLFGKKVFFGGYGMGLTTRLLKEYDRFEKNKGLNEYSGDLYTRFGHGGFWLGYIFKPQKAIHWGADLKLGWGAITLSDMKYPGSDYRWENYATDHVFVVTPQAVMELNLLKWMRLNVGVGYRFVAGIDKTYYYLAQGDENPVEKEYFDNNAFNSVTGNITLAFGWFGK